MIAQRQTHMLNVAQKTVATWALASLVVACACSSPLSPGGFIASDATSDADQDPGYYASGVTVRTFVDTTRPTPANGTSPDKPSRTLVTHIWYPTLSDNLEGEAVPDAPPNAFGSRPLVVFVHGSSGTAVMYSILLNFLAYAGYVVAAADFPNTALSSPGGPNDFHAEEQVRDVAFLFDQLTTLPPSDALAGLVDASAGYAVAGHSTGGTVALLAAYRPDYHDQRVRAAIDLAGDSCFLADSFFAQRSVPLLAIGGTNDRLVPDDPNTFRAFQRASAPAVWAGLKGGTHMHFTDLNIDDPDESPTQSTDPLAQTCGEWGGGGACLAVAPPSDFAPMLLVNQLTTTAWIMQAFLDAHLRNEPKHLSGMTGFFGWHGDVMFFAK